MELKSDFKNAPASPEDPGQDHPVSLADLAPGEFAVIVDLESDTEIGRRLGDLGFLPGTPVSVLSRAPLGDPTVYEVRGCRFCLRRTEARRIAVRPGAAPTDG